MKLSENAETLLKERYYQEGENWEKLCHRVAYFLDVDEMYAEQFYKILKNCLFLSNSPTLMNAGTGVKNLAACFVLPVPDRLDGIYDILKTAALIHASGGGTGFDFSELRPKGSIIGSTRGTTLGPVSFLKVYNASTEIIKQGGRRRGANMGVMRVDHRDIMEFINCKCVEGDVANFNISVAITDEFMKACEDGESFTLDYNLHGLDPIVEDANMLMDKIVANAWQNGEPGLFFIDTANRLSGIDEHIAATNPCGEIDQPPYGSCTLGSINLSKLVKEGKVNYPDLREVVHYAIRFLDNVITKCEYTISEISERTLFYRPLGLGVMGWADMLIKLGVVYGSKESFELAEKVMIVIQDAAQEASKKLCEEKGENGEKKGRRHARLTSIAPTGSLSLIANCSSGIEPNFEWMYESHRVDQIFTHYHPLARKYLEKGEKLPEYFVTTFDVVPEQHVDMQIAFQKHTDHSISKTINLKKSATKEDIKNIFFRAWRGDCKGITVYRDGSRKEQVLVAKTREEIESPTKIAPIQRPRRLNGVTGKEETTFGSVYVTVNFLDKVPIEVFLNIKDIDMNGLSRMISLALRSNVSVDEVIKQLVLSGGEIESAVANVLQKVSKRWGEIKEWREVKGSCELERCAECNL